jgi:hypothetical protein
LFPTFIRKEPLQDLNCPVLLAWLERTMSENLNQYEVDDTELEELVTEYLKSNQIINHLEMVPKQHKLQILTYGMLNRPTIACSAENALVLWSWRSTF